MEVGRIVLAVPRIGEWIFQLLMVQSGENVVA